MRGVNSANTEGRRLPALRERNVGVMAEGVPSSPKRFLVRTFYLFVSLSEGQRNELRRTYQPLGEDFELSGALLLSPEGLNATIAGREESVRSFFACLRNEFPALSHQDSFSQFDPFKRWKVLHRKWLVPSPHHPSTNFGADKSPREWDDIRRMVREQKAQMIDVRNAYEIQIGTFPEALNPETSSFKEFGEALDGRLGESLDPALPTAIFCTGGIRCEKARLLLRERGFHDVWPLKGGILNYLKEDTEDGFQGECFVFDLRVAVDRRLSPTNRYKTCPTCGGATPIDGERHKCTREEV